MLPLAPAALGGVAVAPAVPVVVPPVVVPPVVVPPVVAVPVEPECAPAEPAIVALVRMNALSLELELVAPAVPVVPVAPEVAPPRCTHPVTVI